MIHEFVKHIPNDLKDGVIYASIPFKTVIHKCCCGCGNEVVTPLSPTDWELTFDDESISLYPSIGNWSFKCKSHYWIRNNKVKWSWKWTRKAIQSGRRKNYLEKMEYYGNKKSNDEKLRNDKLEIKDKFWSKFKTLWTK